MPKRIYVGRLSAAATDDQVRQMFARYGRVERITLDGSGAGYVWMSDGADEAIAALDQTEMGGSRLNVNEA